jgi:hypothetical protein
MMRNQSETSQFPPHCCDAPIFHPEEPVTQSRSTQYIAGLEPCLMELNDGREVSGGGQNKTGSDVS